MPITDEHIQTWHKQGFVVVENFLSGDELEAVQRDLPLYLPTVSSLASMPSRLRQQRNRQPEMEHGFPFASDALNDVSLHPELIGFVETALGTTDIALTMSLLWGRYPKLYGDVEQALHSDYGNQSLVYPRDDGAFRQIPMIIYYSDVTADLAPTYVVSQEHTGDYDFVPNWHWKENFPALYEFEQPVVVSAGSLLIYSQRTFHRGSSFRATSGARYAHGLVWQAAAHRWMGFNVSWARHGGEPEMDRLIERATPRQREVFGFPPAGDPYWNEETLKWVAARYPGLDIAPYRALAAVEG